MRLSPKQAGYLKSPATQGTRNAHSKLVNLLSLFDCWALPNTDDAKKPVVIPRVDFARPLEVPLPFMRAYSLVLQAHGIFEEDFVAFLDNLTVAQGPPAPLTILNTAGSIAGLV